MANNTLLMHEKLELTQKPPSPYVVYTRALCTLLAVPIWECEHGHYSVHQKEYRPYILETCTSQSK